MSQVKHMTRKALEVNYLRDQTSGHVGDFNKKYFPRDFAEMKKELEELESEERPNEK